jgi:GAF domain-containing protein
MTKLADLLAGLAEPGQPEALFTALDRLTRSLVGHRLFTLNSTDGQTIARAYSSHPTEYPVSGRKTVGQTEWDDLVIRRRQPFLGPDRPAIRRAFPDHALIESMGLGAVINLPVVYDGATIGTLNLLDAEHRYTAADLDRLRPFPALLIPAFLARQPGHRPELAACP